MISPDDKVTGSPFADPDGKGMEKYLDLVMSKPSNQRPSWWELLLER